MHNRLKQLIALSLILLSSLASANCRLESEIPSSTPDNRFTIHSNGTVTDNTTDLMWAKCLLGQNETDCSGSATALNWQSALQVAETSVLAGHTDWRLPNIKELRSIVENRCYNPGINLVIFPNTPSSFVWSASPHTTLSSYVWYVRFAHGDSYRQLRSLTLDVRLVRSGQ